MDVVLCLLDHVAVAVFVKIRAYVGFEHSLRVPVRFAVSKEILHRVDLQLCSAVCRIRFREIHVDDEDDLLLQVVEGNDLVKEHQIHVLEVLCIIRVQMQRLLCVLQIIVGEISNQPPCKGRKVIDPRCLVLG